MLVGSLIRLFSTMPGLTDQLLPVNRLSSPPSSFSSPYCHHHHRCHPFLHFTMPGLTDQLCHQICFNITTQKATNKKQTHTFFPSMFLFTFSKLSDLTFYFKFSLTCSFVRFWLTFAGQAVMAMGHPFLITMSTKVIFAPNFDLSRSQSWVIVTA